MTKFDDLYEVAVDSYGLITSSEAKELGVKPVEMKRYAGTGRLERRGRGVYRLVRWVPTLYDGFAEAVALVGPDAYSHGDAVLALLELAMANPRTVAVASPRRCVLANTVVAQMMPAGVVKGGSGMQIRFGYATIRFSADLDVARFGSIEAFVDGYAERLRAGWGGFTGRIVARRSAKPLGAPMRYVMQPFDVRPSFAESLG